jgi:hypothetical protein
VNEAVRSIFSVSNVDTITAPGMVKYLSDETESPQAAAALSNVALSLDKHGSQGIAVAAHYDCAANPCSDEEQQEQLQKAVAFLKERFPAADVVGVWVGSDWVAIIASARYSLRCPVRIG